MNSDFDCKASVIIPCCDKPEDLERVLTAILGGMVLPREIILIDTSRVDNNYDDMVRAFSNAHNLPILITKHPGAYPGEARNIGIEKSSSGLIAFLDVKTLPDERWLYSALEILKNNPNASGVWGMTKYDANTVKEKIIRCATFGENPIRTVPGTLIKSVALKKVGQFLPETRAGEDTDWMKRLILQKIAMIDGSTSLIYYGLIGLGLNSLFFKWLRNYTHSAKLPYLYAHKNIYYHFLVLIALLGAFNWNWVIANWDMESEFYLPHITKLSIAFLVVMYSVVRAILMPIRKGCRIEYLMPFRWILVLMISILLDVAKILGFLKASIYRVK